VTNPDRADVLTPRAHLQGVALRRRGAVGGPALGGRPELPFRNAWCARPSSSGSSSRSGPPRSPTSSALWPSRPRSTSGR